MGKCYYRFYSPPFLDLAWVKGKDVFQGTSLLTLDQKGRLLMPSRYKDVLVESCAGELTLTRHPDGCLVLYPRPCWESKRAQIVALPNSARGLVRLILGSAVDVVCDKVGRVLIPQELRTMAGLDREVAMVGMGEHFEIWDRSTWLALCQDVSRVDLESIDFTF